MKKAGLFTGILILLFISTGGLYALEVGTSFHIGNLAFAKERASTDTTFTGLNFPWGIDAYVNHSVTDQIGIQAGYYMDPILRNTMYTLFTFKESFLSLGVGPFFGLFNSTTSLLKSGIATIIRLEFPGVIFLQFRADSSIGGRIVQEGDYIQERNDITFGFYIPNAICSLGLSTKKYTSKSSTGEIVDDLRVYSFTTDIFQKNVPYKVLINFAFHQLSKSFIESTATTIHTLDSLVAGFDVSVNIAEFLTITAGLDSSIYTFGMDALLGVTNPGPGGYLFETNVGCKINIDKIISKTKVQ